jgi:hypothetical protein
MGGYVKGMGGIVSSASRYPQNKNGQYISKAVAEKKVVEESYKKRGGSNMLNTYFYYDLISSWTLLQKN